MPVNKVDEIYRSFLLTKYFVKGWGKPENIKKLCELRKVVANREECFKLVSPDYSVEIDKEWEAADCHGMDGHFISPLVDLLPGVVPVESENSYFQFIFPKTWKSEKYKPVCINLAGTGDHYFWRRRNFFARPLVSEYGIGSLLIENPFYGKRKPKEQMRSALHNVSDIFVMGGCLLLESLVLLHFCKRLGLGPLGFTGISMGGQNASISATSWPEPLVIVPCLSGLTASSVFTQGVMSKAINWTMLEDQYASNMYYKEEIQKILKDIPDREEILSIEDAYEAGKRFVENLTNDSFWDDNHHVVDSPVSDLEKAYKGKASDQLQSTASEVHSSSNSTDTPNGDSHKWNASRLLSVPTMSSVNALSKYFYYLKDATTYKTSEWIQNHYKTPSIEDLEAYNFMRGIMDECTHLKNYAVPVDTSLVVAVYATDDGYVPLPSCKTIKSVWPEAEVRFVRGGHIQAYIRHQKVFRKAVGDAFEKAKEKYYE